MNGNGTTFNVEPACASYLAISRAYIDLDVVSRNIGHRQHELPARCVGLRPHMKTHKTIKIGRMHLLAGAIGDDLPDTRGAEVLVEGGFDVIFNVHPICTSGERGNRVGDLREELYLRIDCDSREVPLQQVMAVEDLAKPLEVVSAGTTPYWGCPSESATAIFGAHATTTDSSPFARVPLPNPGVWCR